MSNEARSGVQGIGVQGIGVQGYLTPFDASVTASVCAVTVAAYGATTAVTVTAGVANVVTAGVNPSVAVSEGPTAGYGAVTVAGQQSVPGVTIVPVFPVASTYTDCGDADSSFAASINAGTAQQPPPADEVLDGGDADQPPWSVGIDAANAYAGITVVPVTANVTVAALQASALIPPPTADVEIGAYNPSVTLPTPVVPPTGGQSIGGGGRPTVHARRSQTRQLDDYEPRQQPVTLAARYDALLEDGEISIDEWVALYMAHNVTPVS